jgi:predicted nuclease of predicted toxin-antitoxin system
VKFKVDENLPIEVAGLLRAAGHDADTVHDERMAGAPDSLLGAILRRENRALVTLDLGFADLRGYPPEQYHGLVVLRLVRQDKEQVLQATQRLVTTLTTEPLAGRLWIIEDARIRIRGA